MNEENEALVLTETEGETRHKRRWKEKGQKEKEEAKGTEEEGGT